MSIYKSKKNLNSGFGLVPEPEFVYNRTEMILGEKNRRLNLDDKNTTSIENVEDKAQGSSSEENGSDNEDQYEKVCYVCRRPESKAGNMITMPGGM